MKLDTNALLKAGGIGLGGGLVLGLASQVPLVGLLCCCLVPIAWVGAGVLYGLFAKNNDTEINAGQFAIGGAIAGLAAGVGTSIINIIASSIVLMTSDISDLMSIYTDLGIDLPPEMLDVYANGGGTGYAILGVVMVMCGMVFFAAAAGAIGGAAYGGIVGSNNDEISPAV